MLSADVQKLETENRILKEISTKELEEQIKMLQAQISYLMNGKLTPAKRLEAVRRECREKYFGTWEEMSGEKVEYGPDGKQYQDFSIITEIIQKTTTLLYKYSVGKAHSGSQINNLITTEQDLENYKAICEAFCRDLREKVDMYTKKTV